MAHHTRQWSALLRTSPGQWQRILSDRRYGPDKLKAMGVILSPVWFTIGDRVSVLLTSSETAVPSGAPPDRVSSAIKHVS